MLWTRGRVKHSALLSLLAQNSETHIFVDRLRDARSPWSQLAPNAGVLEIEMSTFFALIGANVGGWIGWVVGAPFGLMTACMLSVVGTALGVYGGRRVASSLLD